MVAVKKATTTIAFTSARWLASSDIRLWSSRGVVRTLGESLMPKVVASPKQHCIQTADQLAGNWKGNPPLSLDTLESRLKDFPSESKDGFLSFLRSMLRWRPEDRATARDLLNDPWLDDSSM